MEAQFSNLKKNNNPKSKDFFELANALHFQGKLDGAIKAHKTQ